MEALPFRRFNQPEFFPLFLIVSLPMQSRFQQVSKQRKRSLFSENRKKKKGKKQRWNPTKLIFRVRIHGPVPMDCFRKIQQARS